MMAPAIKSLAGATADEDHPRIRHYIRYFGWTVDQMGAIAQSHIWVAAFLG